MKFEAALDVLGISVEAGVKGARRAHLRLIRKHKPEQDPEGFQRIRGANELVVEQFNWHLVDNSVELESDINHDVEQQQVDPIHSGESDPHNDWPAPVVEAEDCSTRLSDAKTVLRRRPLWEGYLRPIDILFPYEVRPETSSGVVNTESTGSWWDSYSRESSGRAYQDER